MRYTDTESDAMADTEIYTAVSFCTAVHVPAEVKDRSDGSVDVLRSRRVSPVVTALVLWSCVMSAEGK